MTAIHEIQQFLWVNTPHGDGQALFLIDYGPHENTVWVVVLQKDGAIKHYNSNHITICINNTFDINLKNHVYKSKRVLERHRDTKTRRKTTTRKS